MQIIYHITSHYITNVNYKKKCVFYTFFFLRYVFSHSQNAMCENTRRQCKEKPEEARILYTFTELYLTSCNYHGFYS